MNDFKKKGIYFLPLGGADEIGMNMFVYAANGKLIVVDAGYGFLNDDFPGMDMCYASPEFLENYRDDILGLFITHGHEDHLGAIAQIWPALQCPVYGTDFSLGLVKERLSEYKLQDIVPLVSVNKEPVVKLDGFEVEFIPIAHSIPETSALFIKTPYGNIMHATDWRFDDNKLSMVKTDFASLKRAASEGVDIFVCDSTNVMVDEPQASEEEVRQNLIKIIPEMQGGIVATCFASNIMRLESLMLAARAALRTGSGIVYLGVPEAIYSICAGACASAVVFPLACDAEGKLSLDAVRALEARLSGMDAVLFGCGVGQSEELQLLLKRLLQNCRMPLVLDADGINLLAQHMDVLRGSKCPVILTPHDGEFRRLGGNPGAKDRVFEAMRFAAQTKTILLLKGHRTIITDGLNVYRNTTGSPGMATGGSGDVLSGVITSLLGQHVMPLEAAAAGAWIHGAAGDLAAREIGEYGMIPEDIIERLPRLLR